MREQYMTLFPGDFSQRLKSEVGNLLLNGDSLPPAWWLDRITDLENEALSNQQLLYVEMLEAKQELYKARILTHCPPKKTLLEHLENIFAAVNKSKIKKNNGK